MPTNNGNYTLPPVYKAEPGTTIRSEQHNVPLEDLAVAMNGTIARDGTRPLTANLNMGGRKITGLATGTAPGDAVRLDQIPPGINGWLLSVSNLVLAANQIPYATGATSSAATNLTAFGRSLIDDENAAASRTTLGLGTLATKSNVTVSDISASGTPSGSTYLRGDGSWASTSVTNIPDSSLSTNATNTGRDWVLARMAMMPANAIGSLMFAAGVSVVVSSVGQVVAGSELRPANAGGASSSGSLPGTWRALGVTSMSGTGPESCTLFVRIS